MSDITIDTNVFVHALNPEEIRNSASLNLLQTLLSTTCKIVIDIGFDMDESKNKSLIGAEYLKHLPPGSLPYAIVADLAQNGRISFVEKSTQPHISKKINQTLRNRRDRTFIIVCINSERKTLVTQTIS